MHGIPIIRLEVESMKFAIQKALTEKMASMDKDIQTAVDRICTPENITRIVETAAAKQIEEAIRQEVSNFYAFGDGRKAVVDAVAKTLALRG